MITTNLANTAHATLTDSCENYDPDVDYIKFMGFDKEMVRLSDPPLVYDHNPELNAIVTDLMNDWYRLVMKARAYGMDIRFAPNCTETLELYFHNDYPDMLLVDKSISCTTASKEVAE